MKKKILIGVGVVMVVIIATLTILNQNQSKQLTLGVITGISGEYSYVGEGFVNGVKLAQEEWNTANPNKNINIIVEDDKFDPKTGLSAYKKLVDVDKVQGLVNMTTFTIDVIAEDVAARNLPVAQGFIQTNIKDDSIIQLWPSATVAEKKLGEYLKAQGYKNIALFVSRGSSVFTSFANDFKVGYGLPLTEYKVGSEPTDLRTAVLKSREIKPDAAVFIVIGNDGAILVQEFEKIYSKEDKPKYVFDANLQSAFESSYKKILGNTNILNGSIVYIVPINYTTDFTKKYKEKYGTAPGFGSDVGYNAFMLIAKSYDSNNNKWIKNMKGMSFVGADGEIKLDETGTRIPELKISTIENGKLPQ